MNGFPAVSFSFPLSALPSRFWYSSSSALNCRQFRSMVIACSYQFIMVGGGFSPSISFHRIGAFKDHLNSSIKETLLYPNPIAAHLKFCTCSLHFFSPCWIMRNLFIRVVSWYMSPKSRRIQLYSTLTCGSCAGSNSVAGTINGCVIGKPGSLVSYALSRTKHVWYSEHGTYY